MNSIETYSIRLERSGNVNLAFNGRQVGDEIQAETATFYLYEVSDSNPTQAEQHVRGRLTDTTEKCLTDTRWILYFESDITNVYAWQHKSLEDIIRSWGHVDAVADFVKFQL